MGGKWLKDVRFADDQAMVASSELGLQTIMDEQVRVAKHYDIKINVTKIMRISKTGERDVTLYVEGQIVEQVTKFKYLYSSMEGLKGRLRRE